MSTRTNKRETRNAKRETVPPPIDKAVLILGGAGLVGAQIAHQVARDLRPQKVIIASLYQKEVR